MVDIHLLSRRRGILARLSLPLHLRHLPVPCSPLHRTTLPTLLTAAVSITRSTKRPRRISSLEKLPSPVDITAFPSPYRHHYNSFHTPTSHLEMICPWLLGMQTWQVRGPTRGLWVNHAKLFYKQFEVRGMDEYMHPGDEGEWETDDEELEDVEAAAGLLLKVATGGSERVRGGQVGGDFVIYEEPERVEDLGNYIAMPDFEPYADVGLVDGANGEQKDSLEGGEEGSDDSESSMFI